MRETHDRGEGNRWGSWILKELNNLSLTNSQLPNYPACDSCSCLRILITGLVIVEVIVVVIVAPTITRAGNCSGNCCQQLPSRVMARAIVTNNYSQQLPSWRVAGAACRPVGEPGSQANTPIRCVVSSELIRQALSRQESIAVKPLQY